MKLSDINKMTITLHGGPLDGKTFDRPENINDLPRTVTITYPCSDTRAHKNRYRLLIKPDGTATYQHAEVEGCPWLQK